MRLTEEQLQQMEQGSSPRPTAPARPEVDPRTAEAMERGSRPPPPTGAEKWEEIGTGTAQGVVEGAAMTLLPYASTKAGMQLGLPFGPKGIAAGGVAGFLAGTGAGAYVTSAASRLFPDVPREELAPYREGGRTMGISMAMAPWAFKIPVERAQEMALLLKNVTPEMQKIPNGLAAGKTGEFLLRTIAAAGQTAKKHPKAFLTSELLASVGAGAAGGAAIAHYPGDSAIRFGAEAVGGALAPGRHFALAGGSAMDVLSMAKKSFSKGSRQQVVADKLLTILKESGENPSQILRRLEEPELTGVSLTAGQKSGSMALSALETTLARNNVQYSRDMRKQAEDAFRAHTTLMRALNGLADIQPGARSSQQILLEVAQQRQTHFKDMIKTRLALAEQEAAIRASRLKQDTPQNRAAIGTILKDQAMDAVADIRAHENVLWNRALAESREIVTDAAGNRIVQVKAVRPRQTAEEYLDIVTSMTEARYQDLMPPVVKKQMAAFGITDDAIDAYRRGKLTPEYIETGRVPPSYLTRMDDSGTAVPLVKSVDVQDLITTRGDLLAFARNAAAKGDLAEASFYGRLAESLLDDLDQLSSPAYNSARQFSKTVNDVLRGYTGTVTRGKTATGAERVPAELLITRAFSSNADLTGMRMREIQDAVGLMGRQYDDAVRTFGADSPQALELRPFAEAAQQRVDSIIEAQQRGYLLAASKTLTPEGRVNPARLSNFLEENRTMLEQLGIADDLADAVRAENVFRALDNQTSYINRTMEKQTAFAKLLARGDDPTQAVMDVLAGAYPVKNFQRIARLAKSGGPDAVEGLRSTIYDYAFTRAGGMERFDPVKYKEALFTPLRPGQPSVMNMLRSEGLISKDEIRNMLQILRPMERIQAAQGNEKLLSELVENADVITEFGLRVMGSKIGRFAGPAGSSSLIAAQAGSSAVRNIFDKQPNILIRGIMEEATRDPQLMAMLLRKGKAADHNFRFARGLHGHLAAAGLNFAEFDEPLPQQAPPNEGPLAPVASEMLWNLLGKQPPAPSTRGVPNLQLQTPPQGPAGEALDRMPAGQEPMPGPTSSSREMFERLFPNEMS